MLHIQQSKWTVIGAGPCGIGSVGRLLDYGAHVTWVDPKFLEGRMGDFYKNVPSNTLNGDLITGLNVSPALCFRDVDATRRIVQDKMVMSDLDFNTCYDLGVFVSTLADVRDLLMRRVAIQKGEVSEIIFDCDSHIWKVYTRCGDGISWHTADVVLYCGGSRPSILPECPMTDQQRQSPSVVINEVVYHNLDYMVDPKYCAELICSNNGDHNNEQHSANSMNENHSDTHGLCDARWAVVGNSHSAMLVMMNLYGAGVRNIVNFHRSDLRFMHDTEQGWRRYQGIGLKGPVGAWAKSTYINNPHIHPIRVSKSDSTVQLLREHNITHCVVALGYERNMSGLAIRVGDDVLSDQNYDAYDRLTGEIPLHHLPTALTEQCSVSCSRSTENASDVNKRSSSTSCNVPKSTSQEKVPKGRLFGGGIAFPQDLIDGGGNREPWVGFKRSVEQVDLMVDTFCQANNYLSN